MEIADSALRHRVIDRVHCARRGTVDSRLPLRLHGRMATLFHVGIDPLDDQVGDHKIVLVLHDHVAVA
jgi:hypothetical protein